MMQPGTTYIRPPDRDGSTILEVVHVNGDMVALEDDQEDTFIFDAYAIHDKVLSGTWDRVPSRQDAEHYLKGFPADTGARA